MPEELTTEEKIAKEEELYHARLRKIDAQRELHIALIMSSEDMPEEQKAVAIKLLEDMIDGEKRDEAECLEQRISAIRSEANPPKPFAFTSGPSGERDGVDYISVAPCETDTLRERTFKDAVRQENLRMSRIREEAIRNSPEAQAFRKKVEDGFNEAITKRKQRGKTRLRPSQQDVADECGMSLSSFKRACEKYFFNYTLHFTNWPIMS